MSTILRRARTTSISRQLKRRFSYVQSVNTDELKADLRSDTVTKPTKEMRRIMSECAVGDDVMKEDPNVNLLQKTFAEMTGKEAALFVPTGTMGNLCCVLSHCNQRGNEVIIGRSYHIFRWEQGGASQLGGVTFNTLNNNADGTLNLNEIEDNIRPDDSHFPITKLICIENSVNFHGGAVLTTDYVNSVAEIAQRRGLKLHMDGARIFNATTALGTDIKTHLQNVDTVSVCLSKGLCAPVGSIIAGPADFIRAAHRIRKAVGGGMRQAGILASVGLHSITEMTDRLKEDHRRAKTLWDEMSSLGYDMADPHSTNMVRWRVHGIEPKEFQRKCAAHGVLVSVVEKNVFRACFHNDVDDEGLEAAIKAVRSLAVDN